jgi:hypothetical protein
MMVNLAVLLATLTTDTIHMTSAEEDIWTQSGGNERTLKKVL